MKILKGNLEVENINNAIVSLQKEIKNLKRKIRYLKKKENNGYYIDPIAYQKIRYDISETRVVINRLKSKKDAISSCQNRIIYVNFVEAGDLYGGSLYEGSKFLKKGKKESKSVKNITEKVKKVFSKEELEESNREVKCLSIRVLTPPHKIPELLEFSKTLVEEK